MRKYHWLVAIITIFTLILLVFVPSCIKSAEYEVVSLNITPQVAFAGDTISIVANVKNVGRGEGSYSCVLNVDNVMADTQIITLLPGATQKVIFSLTEDKAGTYQVSMGKLSAIFNIKEPALEQLKIDYPELYQELLKLPEMTEINEKNNEAIGQIAYLALQPEYKATFESMLNEGIKDKRKYCTPLQALLWIAYDRDISKDNPIKYGSLTLLINDAWKNTTTSKYFSSERWQDFAEVVDRLNSPDLAAIYMQYNYTYSYTIGEPEGVKSAEQVFKAKSGACYDHAVLAGYCLKKNGYDTAQGMAINFDHAVQGYKGYSFIGHIVCLYQDPKDSLYYVVDNAGGSMVHGPYQSIDDAAKSACSRGSSGQASLKRYSLHQIDLQTGKYEKQHGHCGKT
jgi:hypothetical protein